MEEYQPDIGKLYESEGVAEWVQEYLGKDFVGTCIDVGAYHSRWLSSSWPMEQAGWVVWCIEPNPRCAEYLIDRKNVAKYAMADRNEDNVDFYIVNMGHGPNGEAGATGLRWRSQFGPEGYDVTTTIKVDVRTLDWFIENVAKLDSLDYLAIDTEETELDVLAGIDLNRWNVKVVAVENFHDLTHPDYNKLAIYLRQFNYKRAAEGLVFNEIYVRR